ncbi:oocyte zinc finger protein XlCOF6.1-like [Bombina bombina]|uniref:oocyte zinc finger protein XlCOF6.1-like n=1 Tax=Bombina bombina TaxID=8345 RepID=UPI00235B0CF2|nr:oocyte zinc finger protein XlCOF6.1-like [Bombina bombina]
MLSKTMSDKNQTSDLPDAHRGRLEENPDTGLLNVKEEDETDDMNSHQTEIHCSLPADEDYADIVKVEITEDLCVRHLLEAPDEETSDSISPGRMDVTPSDGSVVEYRGEPYVCDHVKTEEDEVLINTATGENDAKISCNMEQTEDQWLRNMPEPSEQEICDNIGIGKFTNCSNPSHDQSADCGKYFLKRSHLFKHLKMYTGGKGFSCSGCGKCFNKKSNLITHQKIHTGEKAFSCADCGKCFTVKSTLLAHQKTHTGEKSFSCSDCGKCFTQIANLIRHQTIHTGEKAFSCSDCGKCFTLKQTLNRHQKIHTGEKGFSCSDCGKCFTQKSNLIMHQKIHTEEKAFSCSDCGKCFNRKSNLIMHQKIHTGEKAFSCSDCGKCFTLKSTLLKHHKTHTGEKRFSCS